MYEHDLLDGMRHDAHDMRELDLCAECAGQLRAWLGVRPDGDDVVEP